MIRKDTNKLKDSLVIRLERPGAGAVTQVVSQSEKPEECPEDRDGQ